MYDYEKTALFSDWDVENKTEVAEATGLKVSDVEDIISKCKQMQDFHKWLHERREQELPMPESRDDLMHIYKNERPEFLFKKQRQKRHNRKMMQYSQRRHYT